MNIVLKCFKTLTQSLLQGFNLKQTPFSLLRQRLIKKYYFNKPVTESTVKTSVSGYRYHRT